MAPYPLMRLARLAMPWPFVGKADVLHWHALGLHCGYDLVGFRLGHAWIVRAGNDE